MIDFKVPKAKDCVIIDTKNWLPNTSQKLQIYRMSGRDLPTYITQAISVYANKDELKGSIKEGDVMLLTRVVSEIAQHRTFGVDPEDKRYFDAPIMQVIGLFQNDIVDYDSLTLLYDKVLIKKVEEENSGLVIPNSNTMIGEVVKVGTCRFDSDWNRHDLTVKIGDRVLIRDNVTTEITLGDEIYHATEEAMIVGIFQDNNYSLDSLKVINESVIMEPFIPETLGSTLITPLMDYDEADVTDIYNRDLFKVLKADEILTKIKKDDIILINRNVTNYVYIEAEKLFMTNGMNYIEAKIEE